MLDARTTSLRIYQNIFTRADEHTILLPSVLVLAAAIDSLMFISRYKIGTLPVHGTRTYIGAVEHDACLFHDILNTRLDYVALTRSLKLSSRANFRSSS